jgi:hypothetical protein
MAVTAFEVAKGTTGSMDITKSTTKYTLQIENGINYGMVITKR